MINIGKLTQQQILAIAIGSFFIVITISWISSRMRESKKTSEGLRRFPTLSGGKGGGLGRVRGRTWPSVQRGATAPTVSLGRPYGARGHGRFR